MIQIWNIPYNCHQIIMKIYILRLGSKKYVEPFLKSIHKFAKPRKLISLFKNCRQKRFFFSLYSILQVKLFCTSLSLQRGHLSSQHDICFPGTDFGRFRLHVTLSTFSRLCKGNFQEACLILFVYATFCKSLDSFLFSHFQFIFLNWRKKK